MIVIWILFHKYDITLALVYDITVLLIILFPISKMGFLFWNQQTQLNWVGFLITILVIKIKTFFHLCYVFLSSSSSSSSSFFSFFFFLVLLYDPLALLQMIFTGCENSCNPRQLQFEADINKLFVLMCKDRDQISSVDHLIGFY